MRKLLTFICIVIFCFSLVACGNASTNEDNNAEVLAEIQMKDISLTEKFVMSFEALFKTQITDRTPFEPTDKNGEFYKSEYRLDEWKGSVGETGKIGAHNVEIVNYGSCGDPNVENEKLRIYVTTDTIDEALEIFPSAVRAMDPDVSDDEIQEVVDHVREWGIKNGLFIGKLKGTIFSHKDYAQFMLDLS